MEVETGSGQATMWQSCQLVAAQSMSLNLGHCSLGTNYPCWLRVRGHRLHLFALHLMRGKERGLEIKSDVSKVLIELGLKPGLSWISTHLRHLLNIFNNDDIQATMCKIISISPSNSPVKIFFIPILLIINWGQRDYLSKAIQLFGNKVRIHQWVVFPEAKVSNLHTILVDANYFILCHSFF